MKIVHIISNLGNGGAERLVVDLSEEQVRLGHNVTIVSFRDVNLDLYPELSEAGVALKTFSKKKGLDLSLSYCIYKFLGQEQPKVVNCHLPSVFLYMIFSLCFLKKVKFFYTIHNNPQQEESRKLIRNIRRFFMKRGRLVPITISDQIRKSFQTLYQLRDVPMVINGRKPLEKTQDFERVVAEIAVYKKNAETKIFIAVGRITEQKNYLLLLNVFSELEKQGKNVVLLILGSDSGSGLQEKYNHVKPDNTFFLGPKKNVADYLFCSDFFCMSSVYEGLPISMIEAMSVGLPVISTNVGGVQDIVKSGENGILVNSLEVGDYLDGIETFLLMTETELGKMRRNNMNEFEEKYNIKNTATEYIRVYQKYISR